MPDVLDPSNDLDVAIQDTHHSDTAAQLDQNALTAIQHQNNKSLIIIAQNTDADIGTLRMIMNDMLAFMDINSEQLHRPAYILAMHAMATQAVKHKRYDLASALLQNDNTPDEALTVLLDYDDPNNLITTDMLQQNIARHLKASSKTLDTLSFHRSNDVKTAVAVHKNTTSETLDNILLDPNHHIKRAALGNNNIRPSRLDDYADEYPLLVAGNQAAFSTTLDKLSTHPKTLVKRAVCKNPSTDSSSLHLLAHNESEDMLECIVQNPNTATPTMCFLAATESQTLRKAVLVRTLQMNEITDGPEYLEKQAAICAELLKQHQTRVAEIHQILDAVHVPRHKRQLFAVCNQHPNVYDWLHEDPQIWGELLL